MAYCLPSDLFDYGLPRGALNTAARLVRVDRDSGYLRLALHGFATGAPVRFRAEDGGRLPAPLEGAPVVYYAQIVDEDTFRVAATDEEDATPLEFSTIGCGVLAIAASPIATSIAWAERLIDEMLPAHLVPLVDPVPEIVRMTCAELAAGKALAITGGASTSITGLVKEARLLLERWAKGIPIRNAPPSHANVATSATAPYEDRAGWNRYGGIGGCD